MSPGQNLDILFCLFIFSSGDQKMKIEVLRLKLEILICVMCMGKKMKIIAIFVDIFFILQNNDDVNKFSFYLYPLKKKIKIYYFVYTSKVFRCTFQPKKFQLDVSYAK